MTFVYQVMLTSKENKGMSIRKLFLPLTVALCAIVAGCGGGGSSESGSGTLNIRLADAPDPTISAINITFTKVDAHIGNEWVEIPLSDTSVNLMDLTDADMLLGTAPVPAGMYTQVRLFPSEVTVTDDDGTHTVNIGSAAQTGIKVNINAEVGANAIQTILLDFNVDKSLIKQGNGDYRLQPVLVGVVKVLSGTVVGTATSDGTTPLDNAIVTAVYKAGDAYPIDTEVNTSASMNDGTFTIWALLPGTYELRFTWTDGVETRSATLTDVVVTANSETNVGPVTLAVE